MSTPFHDSDCYGDGTVYRGVRSKDSELTTHEYKTLWYAATDEISRWEAAYNAVCDERDAIVRDSDKAHALLRQALAALELLKTSPNNEVWVDTADEAITAIKEFLK